MTKNSVVPESENLDTVGCFARTVKDVALVLDVIYGIDLRDNHTFAQQGRIPDMKYSSVRESQSALRGATFGLPWESFWVHANPKIKRQLLELLDLIQLAGATIINGTEIPLHKTIISQIGWDW